MREEKQQGIHILVKKELKEKLQEIALEYDISFSAVCRIALKEYVERSEDSENIKSITKQSEK